MSVLANTTPHRLTLDEYRDLEEQLGIRHEYDNGYVYAMTGGSFNHGRIGLNITTSLDNQTRQKGCTTNNSDIGVYNRELDIVFHPDASVFCGERDIVPIKGKDTITNPVVVIEVLSPTTDTKDRRRKRQVYQAIPSVMDYIIVWQDRIQVLHYHRQDEDWLETIYGQLKDVIVLEAIGCTLSLKEIYYEISWPLQPAT